MIERVHFKNFKSLQDVTLDLGPLTALVGVNGCGKSSALEGIHLLSQTGRRAPRSANPNQENFLKQRWQRLGATFSGARSPRRLATQDQPTDIELSMRALDQDALHLTISLPALTDEDRADDPLTFHVSLDGPAGALSASIPPTHGEDADLVLDHPRVRRFTSAVYLNLNAREMARASIPEGTHPRMRFDGYGLASTLAWMKGEVEEELAMITEDLRKIVPGVRRIRTQRQELTHRRTERMTIDGQPIWRPVEETILGDRFAVEFDGGHVIPADLLSEGTVLALGLLTKLREPKRPRLVLLDDIDRGLHISAQATLVQALRSLQALDPALQIVCTTHSPYLLDLFTPEEVRVLALDPQRHTHAMPLTAHPDLDQWRFGTQTGELLAALGTDWVVQAQAPLITQACPCPPNRAALNRTARPQTG